ncbi:hypothetical protein [Streptomyces sp. A012304]|uniref:hypothetical protein n=1 Tax=Streptomyces sp. A012304 TaxID=375446 RepID=UPI00222FF7FB|nr:hypothetical protein [Streptomyces sp. A012304]GKQ38988.1 hypothetical protein ALMP_55170 [Streptomyces sp. A012304]
MASPSFRGFPHQATFRIAGQTDTALWFLLGEEHALIDGVTRGQLNGHRDHERGKSIKDRAAASGSCEPGDVRVPSRP